MHALKLLLLAAVLLLLPGDALAWGPAAHLEFSLAILQDLTLLAPAIAAILRKFPDDFHYGNIAADITQAKNLSPYRLHCHNWQVAFSLLDLSEDEAARAFSWGYLSHLAADIVAHNYLVPCKLVQHFQRRRAHHAYWEMRFDMQASREAWDLARRLSARSFKHHDQHMKEILTAPVFSFRVNKEIFNGMRLIHRLLHWKRMVVAHTRRTTLRFTQDEADEFRALAIGRMLDLLGKGTEASCLDADPTGQRNILIARDVRKRLRRLHLQGRLLDPDEIGPRFRPLFRDAMNGSKLILPSLREFIDPSVAPAVPVKRRTTMRKRYRSVLRSIGERGRRLLRRWKRGG